MVKILCKKFLPQMTCVYFFMLGWYKSVTMFVCLSKEYLIVDVNRESLYLTDLAANKYRQNTNYQLLYLIADCLMVCCSLKHILKKEGWIFWGPFVVTNQTLGEWIIDLLFLRVVRRFIYRQRIRLSINISA